MESIAAYEAKKPALQRALSEGLRTGRAALGKSTSNLFRHRDSRRGRRIDVRHLNNVISIDTQKRLAEVEGMTTYETLVDECLPHALMPTVAPEFKTITVGGAVTGVGLESSSLNYGFVHETVEEMEVLLADGSIVTCSRREHGDLFVGFPNSYGTLGYALKVTLPLVPARKYVRLLHVRHDDFEDYFRDLQRVCGERPDFVDGTIFGAREMYITRGDFVDEAPQVSDYTYLAIYYKSVRAKTVDYLTTRDYIWRWDTDWFWRSHYFGGEIPLVRRLLGRRNLRSSFYWKIRDLNHRSRIVWAVGNRIYPNEAVIQDAAIPLVNASEFADFLEREIGIHPVWICPVRPREKGVTYPLYAMDEGTLYVNFGFWDMVRSQRPAGYLNRKVEEKVKELRGRKMLYSDSFYSREEFREVYGGNAYDALKAKYDPTRALGDLYDKCVRPPEPASRPHAREAEAEARG